MEHVCRGYSGGLSAGHGIRIMASPSGQFVCAYGIAACRTQGIEGKYDPAGSTVSDPAVTFFFSMSFVLTLALVFCECQPGADCCVLLALEYVWYEVFLIIYFDGVCVCAF